MLAKFVVLRQLVGDGIPRRFGPDKNVCARANIWSVAECSQSDVNKLAFTHHGKQKAPADPAMNIVGRVLVTEDQKVAVSLSKV